MGQLLALVPARLAALRVLGSDLLLLGRADDRLAHGLGDLDDVGARLAEDRQLNGLLAVDPHDDLTLRMRAAHAGHVAHAHGGIAAADEGQRRDLVGVAELVERADQEPGRALLHLAARGVEVLGRQPTPDRGRVEPLRSQRAGIHGHLDLLLEAPPDLDRSHAGQALQLALDAVLGHPAEARERLAGCLGPRARRGTHRDAEDRVEVRVVAQDQRALGLARELHVVQAVAHLLHGQQHVRAPVELEQHVAEPGATDR